VEKVFIQKIFQITERILRRDVDDAEVLQQLQGHLRKAQQMNFQQYEAEVLNTLGILASMQADPEQAQSYWRQALETAEEVGEADLLVKLLNNLSSALLETWQIDEAIQYVQRGLSIVQQHGMKTLTTLYIYGTAVSCHMALGQYKQAEEVHNTFLALVQEASLHNYSRFEYAQIITSMHEVRVQLDIVARDNERFLVDINTLKSFVEQINRDDFTDGLIVQGLLYALIIHNDEKAALYWEQQLIERHEGMIHLAQLLPLANFLIYNQRPVWAKKYAQQIVNMAVWEPIPAALLARAKEILAS
jgi:tetratricopeptide (TPR) repeat protein